MAGAADEAALPVPLIEIDSLRLELFECVCYGCSLQSVARLACTSKRLRAMSYRGVLPLMAPETANKKVDIEEKWWNDGKVVLARWAADRGASAAVVTALLGAHGTVEANAFLNCDALKTISIPEGVQTIGGAAFGSCKALETVTLPASVQEIGSAAFQFCTALKTISLPASVRTIGNYAFDSCIALKSITLPRSLKGQMANAYLTTEWRPGLKVTFT